MSVQAEQTELDLAEIEYQAQEAAKKGVKNVNQEKLDYLKKCYAVVANTPEGEEVLRHIMNTCGFKQSNVMYNRTTGEIAEGTTLLRAAQQATWVGIRQYIPVKPRNAIEGDIE